MATSYLNTGVLGQVTGGTLGTAGLASEFRQFRDNVQRQKRTVSGISREERDALRKRREERLADSVETTALHQTNPETGALEVVKPGVMVDTADVKVPAIPVERDAPTAVQQKQKADNIAASKLGITKVPTVAKPAPVAAPVKMAPERKYTDKDVAFAHAFDSYYRNISSKNNTDVNKGKGALQGQLQSVLDAAKATGRQDVLTAVQGIGGILGQKHISARNVGQAKASTNAARASIRNTLDLEHILKTNPQTAAAPAANVTTTTLNRVTRVGRGFFFGR